MAVASWKGAIAFGPLIRFNVRAVAVDKEIEFPFNTHHAADGGRLRSQLSICEVCGETVEKDDIVSGYRGAYPVDKDYLKSLEYEKSSVMELDGLVPASQIEPRWYKREYDVIAEKGAEQPYVLFMNLLEQSGRVAIGKVVIGGKEAIVTVRPRAGVLSMDLMWWPEELKAAGSEEARTAIAGVVVSDQMMKVGGQLVKMMSKEFVPETYRNEYAAAVAEYLEQLQAGQVPTPIVQKPQAPKTSQSLEEALMASLAAMGGEVEEKVAKKTGRKSKVA